MTIPGEIALYALGTQKQLEINSTEFNSACFLGQMLGAVALYHMGGDPGEIAGWTLIGDGVVRAFNGLFHQGLKPPSSSAGIVGLTRELYYKHVQ